MKPRPVGINHVALQVDDIDEAMKFYSQLFDFKIREREPGHVEIDLGDQFIALEDKNAKDPEPHFGLAVKDKEAVRGKLKEASVEIVGSRLDFRDPWGNRIQIVQYDQIQFLKDETVMKKMDVPSVKNEASSTELKDHLENLYGG